MITDLQPARRVPRRHARGLGRGLMVGGVMVCIGRALVGGVGASTAPTAAETVTVRPGDTVWGIAASHFPGDDLRQMVAEILSLNGLTAPIIQPGETLVLPAS